MSEIRPDILDILQTTICQSPYDWSQDKYHAFIYGIFIGWSQDACAELEHRCVLAKTDIERMNVYHGILNRRASGWQPIETAPKDGTEVLLWSPLFDPCLGAWGHSEDSILDGWMVTDVMPFKWTELLDNPTHWMPLPAPPEVTE